MAGMVGAGTEVLRGFGLVLLLAAGLSVWVALLHAVRARQGDLAMLRMLGAPASRIAALIALEALLLAGLAAVLGLAAGHGLFEETGLPRVATDAFDLRRVLEEGDTIQRGPAQRAATGRLSAPADLVRGPAVSQAPGQGPLDVEERG